MRNRFLIFLSAFLFTACTATYSPYLYERTSELKTNSLSIMDKAGEPYSKYESKIAALKSEFESVDRQEKLRKRNNTKIKQWDLMLDPQGHLLYGYFNKWQNDTILSETFIRLEKGLIEESFETIQATEKDRLK